MEGRASACWETCTWGATGCCSGTVNGAGVFCARAGEEQTSGAERCSAACVDTQWGEGESKVARGYFTRTAERTTVLFPEVREAGRGLGRKRRSCSLALRL